MNKNIKVYLGYTFILSWILLGIAAIGKIKFQTPLGLLLVIPAGLAPGTFGILVKKRYSTIEEFKLFIKNIINPRYNVFWYIIVIILSFAFLFLPTVLFGGTKKQPIYMAIVEFIPMIIGGGLEEIGWRGLLQPELQKKYSVVISTLIVGVIWGAWHIPFFKVPGSHQSSMNYLWFFVFAIALSFSLSAIFNATKSIFLCTIFHALVNSFWDVYVPDYSKIISAFCMLAFSIIVSFVITKIANRKDCTDKSTIENSL